MISKNQLLRGGECFPNSIALNDQVRQYPYPSERYRRVFNAKAEELGAM